MNRSSLVTVLLGVLVVITIWLALYAVPTAYSDLDKRKAACAEAGGKLMPNNYCIDKDIFIEYRK